MLPIPVMNISSRKRGMHIIVGKRQIRRPSASYLDLWITCCNNSTCQLSWLILFSSFCRKFLLIREGKLDRLLINTRMLEGTPIGDHMICMIRLFNEMKILRTEINQETKVDMVRPCRFPLSSSSSTIL